MAEPQQNICARHGNDWVGMAARGGGPIGRVVTSDGVQERTGFKGVGHRGVNDMMSLDCASGIASLSEADPRPGEPGRLPGLHDERLWTFLIGQPGQRKATAGSPTQILLLQPSCPGSPETLVLVKPAQELILQWKLFLSRRFNKVIKSLIKHQAGHALRAMWFA
uniref:Uncharacterized protein n=1 Tax=Setaria viridis TaxID=4556 RepID=A0A4U6STC3_SETVI|nr:hypothetical protein SEVIR_9G134800v2 [Setaria viridis]